MRPLLIVLLALTTLPAFAAQGRRKSDQEILRAFQQNGPWMVPLSKIYVVRENLIRKYVLGTHQIAAVSVCGTDDVFDVPENYLCVYAYRDTIKDLNRDLFDGENTGKIDGVRLVVEVVDRKR